LTRTNCKPHYGRIKRGGKRVEKSVVKKKRGQKKKSVKRSQVNPNHMP